MSRESDEEYLIAAIDEATVFIGRDQWTVHVVDISSAGFIWVLRILIVGEEAADLTLQVQRSDAVAQTAAEVLRCVRRVLDNPRGARWTSTDPRHVAPYAPETGRRSVQSVARSTPS